MRAVLKSSKRVGLILFMSMFAMSVMLLRGIIAASALKDFKSAPLYPYVIEVSSSMLNESRSK